MIIEHDYHNIATIMNGINKQHVVPDYQRPYVWTEERVNQLLEDVWGSYERHDTQYFLGTIICFFDPKGGEREIHEIVDGQQRLITVSLIIRQLTKLEKIKSEESLKIDLLSCIQRRYRTPQTSPVLEPTLRVREEENDFYSRYVLSEDDSSALQRQTNNQKKFVENSKVIDKFLEEKGEENKDLSQFAEHLISKVHLLIVTTGEQSSSFRLFEVLNARGTSLAATDLFKNKLMEQVRNNKEASRQVASKWRDLEKVVQDIIPRKNKKKGDDENLMDAFFTILQISEKKKRDRVLEKGLYDHYTGQLNEMYKGDSVKMITDILISANTFRTILEENSMSFFMGFRAYIKEWAPAIMAFLNKNGMNQFAEFAQLMEKLYMQQWLIGGSMGKRQIPIHFAVQEIIKGESFDNLKTTLLKDTDVVKNEQVSKFLDEADFYGSGPAKTNLVRQILLRLYAGETDVCTTHSGDITIEHILPRKMTDPYWEERFTEEEHKHWLNKLGNLTVIGRKGNGRIKHKGFNIKKEAYQSSKTRFAVTNRLMRYEEWGVKELQQRHAELIKEIEDLWLIK